MRVRPCVCVCAVWFAVGDGPLLVLVWVSSPSSIVTNSTQAETQSKAHTNTDTQTHRHRLGSPSQAVLLSTRDSCTLSLAVCAAASPPPPPIPITLLFATCDLAIHTAPPPSPYTAPPAPLRHPAGPEQFATLLSAAESAIHTRPSCDAAAPAPCTRQPEPHVLTHSTVFRATTDRSTSIDAWSTLATAPPKLAGHRTVLSNSRRHCPAPSALLASS